MRSRRKFYRERPHYIKPTNSELIGEVSNEIYINDDNITFSLVYHAGSITSSSNNFGEGYREILPPFHQVSFPAFLPPPPHFHPPRIVYYM